MKELGEIKINGKEKMLSVEKEGAIYKYYIEDEVIGAYDPNLMTDSLIAFRENTLKNELSEQIRDEIAQIIEETGKDKIVQEDEREQEENVYDRQMGYQKSIGIEEKEKDMTVKSVDKKDMTKQENTKGKEKIENTTADINIKQEVEMDTMATDLDSLGEKLEKAGKIKGGDEKHGKLGIVESDELDNLRDKKGNKLQGHSSRFETVVITNKTGKDGKPIVRALDLENDTQEGNDPTEKNYQVKQNKNVEKGDVLTRLQIEGEQTLGIEKGQYGEVEVYHSSNKTIGGKGVEGNKSLDRQLETSNAKNAIEGTDESGQKLAQEYQDGYRAVEMSYQEADKHENSKDEPCDELKIEDIDGDPNTVSHNHIDEIVTKLMENSEINDKFTEREVRERVEKEWKQKSDEQSLEDFKKSIEEDIEADAEYMRGERNL